MSACAGRDADAASSSGAAPVYVRHGAVIQKCTSANVPISSRQLVRARLHMH